MTKAPTTNEGVMQTRDHRLLIGFIMGGVVGAGLTMLFAPRVAAELRQRVTDSARTLGRAASERYQRASTRVGEAVDQLSKKGYAQMMTRSPGEARCAAAPLIEMTRDPARRLDRIGREALTVGDVVDLDLLVRQDPGEVHEIAVDRARTLVVELGVGHARAVQLALQEGQLHGP